MTRKVIGLTRLVYMMHVLFCVGLGGSQVAQVSAVNGDGMATRAMSAYQLCQLGLCSSSPLLPV